MARWQCTLGLAVALALPGCAAMQRTWDFSVAEVASPRIAVTTHEAAVTQKDVWLGIAVENVSSEPMDLTFETFLLTLPDGQQIEGHVSFMDRHQAQLEDAWDRVRRKDVAEPPLPPGGKIKVQLNFHQIGRDFRRLPTLTVDLAGLLVDGASSQAPPLVLQAPPEAPMGEHI